VEVNEEQRKRKGCDESKQNNAKIIHEPALRGRAGIGRPKCPVKGENKNKIKYEGGNSEK
jgi:hypothetical protein